MRPSSRSAAPATWCSRRSSCRHGPGRSSWPHFGEDASLGAPASQAIATYLADHAADGPQTKGGQRFMAGLSAADAPLRISGTPFWQRAHDELSAAEFTTATVKSPANCIACHKTADRGEFTESD
jgi:hypothetical protein